MKYLLLCLALVVVMNVCAPPAQASIIVHKSSALGLSKGLVGHWAFDGKDISGSVTGTTPRQIYDRSGNGNNGKYWNATGTPPVIGKIGQALRFDGVDDYVEGVNPSSLFSSNFTASAWVKFAAYSNNYNRILEESSIAGGGGYGIEFDAADAGGGDQKPYGTIYDSTNATRIVPASSFSLNTWYPIVLTYDGTTARIYINGSQDGSAAVTMTTPSSPQFNIGRYIGGGSNFEGQVDDVRIYNRTLSADEIKRLYKIGATAKINTTISNDSLKKGLVGHWTFDGPTTSGGGSGGAAVFATNSGGTSFGTSDGVTYSTDTGFTGGGTFSTVDSIAGTTDDTLYQTERFGNFSYDIALSNGSYLVTQKFAEIFHTLAGERVFDVAIEGAIVLDNLDIYALVGHHVALDYSFPVTIADGTLNIVLTSVTDQAKVSAIKITNGIISAKDVSGRGNNGKYWNATGTPPVAGKIGQALGFGPGFDFIRVEDHSSLDFGTGDFSVSVWFKTPRATREHGLELVGKGETAGALNPEVFNFSLGFTSGAEETFHPGAMKFQAESNGSEADIGTVERYDDNTWHHGVAVRSGTTCRLYADGVMASSTISTAEDVTNNDPLLIGCRIHSGNILTRS